jgi:hypothetical protein
MSVVPATYSDGACLSVVRLKERKTGLLKQSAGTRTLNETQLFTITE